jgi:hypothetical protein
MRLFDVLDLKINVWTISKQYYQSIGRLSRKIDHEKHYLRQNMQKFVFYPTKKLFFCIYP